MAGWGFWHRKPPQKSAMSAGLPIEKALTPEVMDGLQDVDLCSKSFKMKCFD
jgi:hypothetical protein